MDRCRDRRTDRQMDGQSDRKMDRQTNGYRDIWMEVLPPFFPTKGQRKLKIYSHRFLLGVMDQLADRWADRQTDRQTDRQKGRPT